jgi:hypothetical protein
MTSSHWFANALFVVAFVCLIFYWERYVGKKQAVKRAHSWAREIGFTVVDVANAKFFRDRYRSRLDFYAADSKNHLYDRHLEWKYDFLGRIKIADEWMVEVDDLPPNSTIQRTAFGGP